VANAILYDTVANVAAIPASPANNDAVEVVNSTGIESFTPLSGKPAGFVGDSGLSVRMVYTTSGATWNWIQYFPNDPETRYGDAITTLQTDLNQAESDILGLDSSKLDATTASSTYQTQAGMSSYLTTSSASSTYAPLASPTFTGTVTIPAGAAISGYLPSATAASTYQTQAGMSSYLTTSAAGSTYAPLASPTFTGTVTIPAGASISGYAALASAQSFTAAQRGSITALTSAATITPNFSAANNYSLSLATNTTLANPSNLTAGQSGTIVITNGGAYTMAFGSYWKFPGGTAPSLTASATDVLAYYVESATRITARLIADVK
jgi:hypothetical protein